ncbi:hypothetical protein BT69DRAFT_1320262 [Atractiella rhizophila]|nr:hypothetical protein BT69DRAFT_1320262 [Atractiella rhizophila]
MTEASTSPGTSISNHPYTLALLSLQQTVEKLQASEAFSSDDLQQHRIKQLQDELQREADLRKIVEDEVDALRQICLLAERDAANNLTSLNELTLVHARLTAQHSTLTDASADFQTQLNALERKANDALREKEHYRLTFEEHKKEMKKKEVVERQKKELEKVVGEYAKLVRTLEQKLKDVKDREKEKEEEEQKEVMQTEKSVSGEDLPSSPTHSIRSTEYQLSNSSQSHLSLPALLRSFSSSLRMSSSTPEPSIISVVTPPPLSDPEEVGKLQEGLSAARDEIAILTHRLDQETSAHEDTKSSLTALRNEEKSAHKLVSSYMEYAQASQKDLLKTLEKLKDRNSKTVGGMMERLNVLQKGLLEEQTRVEQLQKKLAETERKYKAQEEDRRLQTSLRLEQLNREDTISSLLEEVYSLEVLPQALKARIDNLDLFKVKADEQDPNLRRDSLSYFLSQQLDPLSVAQASQPLSPVPIPIPVMFPTSEPVSPGPASPSLVVVELEAAVQSPSSQSQSPSPAEQVNSDSAHVLPDSAPLVSTAESTLSEGVPIPFPQRTPSPVSSTPLPSSSRPPTPSLKLLETYIHTIDKLRSSLARHQRLHPSTSPAALRSAELLSVLGSFAEILRDLEVDLEFENRRLPVLKIEGDEVVRIRAEEGENYQKIQRRFHNASKDLKTLERETKRTMSSEVEEGGGLEDIELKSMNWTKSFNAAFLQHPSPGLRPSLARMRKQSSSPSLFSLGIHSATLAGRLGTTKVKGRRKESEKEEEEELE